VLGPRAYVALWLVLTAISLVLVLVPGIPIAGRSPGLAVLVATINGAVGLWLLQLRVLRFSVLGFALDLFVGLAFGALALANLLVRMLVAVTTPETSVETSVALFLVARVVAGLLFLASLALADDVIPVEGRAWYGLRVTGVVAGLALGAAVPLIEGNLLPSPMDPAKRQQLEAGARIEALQLDQEPWFLLAEGSVCVLLLAATVAYSRVAVRSTDWHVPALAVALTFLLFGELQTVAAGPLPVEYLSSADGFRLVAYALLLSHLVTRITSEVAERASGVERLRLSRELHDGLAQQLSLLQLCLDRLATPKRSGQQRARDLETARRLVEAAALEADQAIIALRTGTVSWHALLGAVSTFAAEFAQNHEVEVHLATEGTARVLGAELQAEVLRILHEACSNAIRHGAATRIDVRVVASPEWLDLRVEDNGSGFDVPLAQAGTGVGIRSITERLQGRGGTLRFDSTPGQGAIMEVGLPLTRRRVVRR
jgi:signal transduction histidine kinase